MSTVTVLHADHGISEAQQDFIAAHVRMFAPPHFFILQVELPAELGTVPNAMQGPACGDPPVEDGPNVYLEARGDRPYADRLIWGEHRPTDIVQVIGTREPEVNGSGNPTGAITLFTVYGGPLAPQHPDDLANADPDASRAFWAQHALRNGRSLEHEVAADITAHMREDS